jgi:5-oxoprolinase (ATP-hydrolysing) subunit A
VARLMELNADVGEGWEDEPLFSYVDRVSIACGGHAGDERSMRNALLLAREMGVLPGAHPGYPDRGGFGRNPIAAEAGDVRRWVVEQTWGLKRMAEHLGTRLFHVKLHGALYHVAAINAPVAREVIGAIHELGGLSLVCLAGAPLVGWARKEGLAVIEEAFADRRYLANGQLAPRDRRGSVIDDPAEAAAQAASIARGENTICLDGGLLRKRADTLCVHGDRGNALDFARAVSVALEG